MSAAPRRPAIGAVAVLLSALPACYATHHESVLREGRETGTARSLVARVEIASGDVAIHRAAPGLLYDLRLAYCRTHFSPRLARNPSGDDATLRVGLKRRRRAGETATPLNDHNALDLGLGVDRPIDLALDLGAGRHRADLGGLPLARLDVSTGAGSATLGFDAPLPGDLRAIAVNAGPGGLTITGLGNASPESVVLQAGEGEIEVDLHGLWRRDASLRLDVRLGDLVLIVPSDLDVEIAVDGRDPADLVLPEFVRDDRGLFRNPAIREARHHVAIAVGAGLGTVEARLAE
jgi:hypothetical protein